MTSSSCCWARPTCQPRTSATLIVTSLRIRLASTRRTTGRSKPRLTLNYGLRYEINGTVRDNEQPRSEFLPGPRFCAGGQGIDGIYNVDYHDFGPHAWFRLGHFRQRQDSAPRRLFAHLTTCPISARWHRLTPLLTPIPECSPSPTWGRLGFEPGRCSRRRSTVAPNDSTTFWHRLLRSRIPGWEITSALIPRQLGPCLRPTPPEPPVNAFSVVQGFQDSALSQLQPQHSK